jgi:hypothetical protein
MVGLPEGESSFLSSRVQCVGSPADILVSFKAGHAVTNQRGKSWSNKSVTARRLAPRLNQTTNFSYARLFVR